MNKLQSRLKAIAEQKKTGLIVATIFVSLLILAPISCSKETSKAPVKGSTESAKDTDNEAAETTQQKKEERPITGPIEKAKDVVDAANEKTNTPIE